VLVLLLGSMSAFAPLSVDMYLPAFPAIGAYFGIGAGGVQGTLAAFFAGFALGQVVVGPLADRFGRRPPLLAGLAVFVAASAGCALAPSIEWLTALRFLQAAAACAGMVVARAVVRDLFPPAEASAMMARLMLVTGVAPMLAPLFGGWLLLVADWQAIFWTLAGLGALALLASATHLPETGGRGANSLRPGAVLAAYVAIGREPRFWRPAVAGASAIGGMFAYIAASPFVLIEGFGVAPANFGWFFGANAAALVAGAQLGPRLARRHGPAAVLRGATAALAAIATALLAASLAGAGLWPVAGLLCLYLGALGLVLPNSAALAMAPFGQAAGSASALLGLIQFGLGGFIAAGLGAVGATAAWPMALAMAGLAATGALLARRV
jgi:DHA1 family bicyclomycin/chloramphenicol resistance-like MFS transporter